MTDKHNYSIDLLRVTSAFLIVWYHANAYGHFIAYSGLICFIEICQVKYLNNLIEQDHRFIKKITKPMMGFKAFYSAQATIDGIETAHMIRKGQLSEENIPAYKQFMALAG